MSYEQADFDREVRFDRLVGSVGATPRTGADADADPTPLSEVRPRLSLVPTASGAVEPALTPADEQWQERALCAQTDPEAFFPEKGGSTREAKRICLGCEVKDVCLDYALANDERFGIWGGLSERERRRLKRGIS